MKNQQSSDWRIEDRTPSVEEYVAIRKSANWESPFGEKAIAHALENSVASVCVFDHDQLIGMGRVVGDGGIYFYIQDVVVRPEYQKKGVGDTLMQALMARLAVLAPPSAFIGLMAAENVASFYHRFGFKERRPEKPGMWLRWNREISNRFRGSVEPHE